MLMNDECYIDKHDGDIDELTSSQSSKSASVDIKKAQLKQS